MDQPKNLAREGGHLSVARITDAWYPLAASDELGARPLARKLYGMPLVVFRGADGRPAALIDRCAHRNAPLSAGRVAGGELECSYHGWRFEAGGRCTHVPSLCGDPPKRRVLASFATREEGGLVWAYATPNVEPTREPFAIAPAEAGYTVAIRVVDAPATLHATIENALDVPHTAFLHRGLFRGAGKRNRIRAVVTRAADRVQTEYVGEPRPEGLVGRLLSPSGGIVTHYDRFILPSIAEVEYRIGAENHILVTACGTPVDDFVTRLYAVIRFRTRFPGWLVKLALEPIALRIFGQDAAMLAKQSATIQSFGGEHYTSTAVDLMGPQIWRLMRRAELGRITPGDSTPDGWRREIDLDV